MGFFKDTFSRADKKEFLLNHDDNAFIYFIFVILLCIFVPLLYHVLKRAIWSLCGWQAMPLTNQCQCSNCEDVKEKYRKTTRSSWLTSGFVCKVLIIIVLGIALTQTAMRFGKEAKDLRKFDPFDILGIQTNATDDEIKYAYRKLARELHPDKNPDDPEAAAKFILLTKAYHALSDEEGKRNFLRYGNPEGQGALNIGIALPEFLIKKENHVIVLVCFFFMLLVLVPGLGLYWYSGMSKFNKHGIYEENMKRYAQQINENLPIKKFAFIMATTAEFEDNINISTEEGPALQRVILLMLINWIVIGPNQCGEAEKSQAKNLQEHASDTCLYAISDHRRPKTSGRSGVHSFIGSTNSVIYDRAKSGVHDALQADCAACHQVLSAFLPGISLSRLTLKIGTRAWRFTLFAAAVHDTRVFQEVAEAVQGRENEIQGVHHFVQGAARKHGLLQSRRSQGH